MVTYFVFGIKLKSCFCSSGSSSNSMISINFSTCSTSSISYIYLLSSSAGCRLCSFSSTCFYIVSSAISLCLSSSSSFYFSSCSCFYFSSSNLLYSSLFLCFALCILYFLFASIAKDTFIIDGSSFILRLYSPPGL